MFAEKNSQILKKNGIFQNKSSLWDESKIKIPPPPKVGQRHLTAQGVFLSLTPPPSLFIQKLRFMDTYSPPTSRTIRIPMSIGNSWHNFDIIIIVLCRVFSVAFCVVFELVAWSTLIVSAIQVCDCCVTINTTLIYVCPTSCCFACGTTKASQRIGINLKICENGIYNSRGWRSLRYPVRRVKSFFRHVFCEIIVY